MPRNSRAETEKRLRIMARGWVEMENGVYNWPDGRPRLDPSGAPQVVKAELMRLAKYSITYRESGRPLFEDPYFLKQLDLERSRYQRSFLAAAYRQEISLVNLGALMLQELWTRVVDDPGCFSSKDLATFGPQIYRLGLDIEAKAASARASEQGDPIGKLAAQNVLSLKPDERAELLAHTEEQAAQRTEKMRALVAAANALDTERIVEHDPSQQSDNGNGAAG